MMRHSFKSYLWLICVATILTLFFTGVAYAQKDSKSGVRPQVISLPGGPGAIEGLGESFEPQLNTGTGRYTISLKVPPGRTGFAPEVRLTYDGGYGNGILGMGWQLPLMSIRRQSDKGLPRYNDPLRPYPDTYINDMGEELVRVSGAESDKTQLFRLKNEGDFNRYTYTLSEDRWVCVDRSGRLYSLGSRMDNTDVNARVRRPDDNMTYAWYIGEASDTNGNRILYSYRKDQQQAYCDSIEYGAVERGLPSAVHRMEFEYENRPDPVVDYRPTFRLVTAQRLKKVGIKSGGNLVRTYLLDYLEGRSVSLLSRVTLIGGDGVTSLPPAEFRYTQSEPANDAAVISILGLGQAFLLMTGENPDDNPGACEILDFNGDGLPDLYQSRYFGSDPSEYDILYENQGNGVFVRKALSESASLGLKIQSQNSFVLDINGDGLPDVVAQKGSNPEDFVFRLNEGGKWAAEDVALNFPVGQTAETVFKSADIRLVDLNSDKQIDTLRSYFTVGPSGSGVMFAAFLNNGDGTFHHIAQTTPDIIKGLPTTFSESNGSLVLADMNGDRLQDLVLLRDLTNGGPKYWPSMGFGKFDDSTSGFVMPLTDGPDFGGDPTLISRLELADLNGDGLADLYYISGSEIRYWLNEGGTKFGAESRINFGAEFDPSVATYRLMDVDGDGLQEVVFYVRTQPTPDYLPKGFSYVRLFRDNTDRLSDGVDNDGDGFVDEADEGNSGPNLLCSIGNGIGRTISLLYGSHVQDMISDKQKGNAWATLVPFPVSVLRRIDIYDGLNSTYKRQFAYHDGYYDGREKEFRGFGSAEIVEIGNTNQGAPTLVTFYEYDTGATVEALKGKPLAVEARTEGGEVFYHETNNWATRVIAQGVSGDTRNVTFPYQNARSRDVIERGIGTAVRLEWEYEYDDYGNMTRQVEHGRMDPGWDDERITETTYTSAYPSGISNWILNRMVEHRTKDANGTLVAQKRNYYDQSLILGAVTKGNLTRVEDWVAGDKYVVSTRNTVDSYGNVISTYDPLYGVEPGHYREFAYDDTYHTYPVSETIHTGKALPPTVTMSATFDFGLGVVTSSKDFNGFTTLYGYDTFGRLTSTTKPPDTDHTIEYDYVLAHALGNGKIINWVETRLRDGSPGDGFLRSRSFYDGLGREVMTREEGEEPGQVVVTNTLQFNARQLPWKKYLPYFETGTLDFTEPTFNTGYTEHLYDALGREIRVNQPAGPDGIVYSTITYEPLVRTVRDEEQTNAASPYYGAGKRYVEDGLLDDAGKGRLRQVFEIVKITDTGDPTSSPVEWETTYNYNLLGNLTGYVDSQGNQKIMEFDGLGRKTFMNDPDRGHMYYTYDDANNLTKTVDAKGQVIQHQYDGINRLTAEYYGEGKTVPDVEYHYDTPAGLLILWQSNQARAIAESILNGNSYAASYDVNHDGKVDVADAVKAARNDQQNTTATAKNTLGYLSWVRDQSGEEHISFDARGRVEWIVKRIIDKGPSDLRNFTTAQEYDSMGRVTKRTYPDQTYVTYNYNSRGFLESVPNVINRYHYNPAGQNALLELANGVVTTYDYDHRLRLSRLRTTRTGDNLVLQDLSYTYGAVSNITSIIDGRDNSTLDTIGQELGIDPSKARKFNATQSFSYDSLYRLVNASNPAVYGTIDYRYDRIGNMIRKNASLLEPDPQMDLGQMTIGGSPLGASGRIGRAPGDPPGPHAVTATAKGPSGPLALAYSDDGNMSSKADMTLSWDYKDRLASLNHGTKNAQYTYDYDDARKRKIVTDTTSGLPKEVIYIDKFSEIREGKLIKYVYDDGNSRIGRSDTGSFSPSAILPSSFYLNDHLGSTYLTLNAGGTVTEQFVNYPYGEPRIEARPSSYLSTTDYRFTGKERDEESGLQYFGARYYDPVVARFMSVDPLYGDDPAAGLEGPGHSNLYVYGRNNPIVYLDPLGLAETAGEFIERQGEEAAEKGNLVETALWSAAGAMNTMFGAESLSKVEVNRITNRNDLTTADKVGAALEVAGALAGVIGKGVSEVRQAYQATKAIKALEAGSRAKELLKAGKLSNLFRPLSRAPAELVSGKSWWNSPSEKLAEKAAIRAANFELAMQNRVIGLANKIYTRYGIQIEQGIDRAISYDKDIVRGTVNQRAQWMADIVKEHMEKLFSGSY